MPSLLKELGIQSPQEAAELERDLGIRFNDLTHDQRETWKRQTVYLGLYAETGTYSHATRGADVTVRTVRTWQTENTLGFNDRLELAVLEYSEGIDLILLQHARRPDCSPSLLMMFVRAQFPEKYGPARRDTAPSRNTNRCDHQCDHDPQPPPTSRYDLQLMEEIFRDLQQLKQFTGLTQPDFTLPNPNLNFPPTDHEPVGAGFKPAHEPSAPSAAGPPTPSPVLGEGWDDGQEPSTQNSEPAVQYPGPSTQNLDPNLSPAGGEIQSGGSPTPPTGSPSRVLGEGWGEGEDPSTQHLEPSTRNLTRSQRRAKRQKSHLARAPN